MVLVQTWQGVAVYGRLIATSFPVFIENETGILLGQLFQHRQCHVIDHAGVLLDKDLPFLRTDVAIPSQISFLERLHTHMYP